jgi:hypothetical protein
MPACLLIARPNIRHLTTLMRIVFTLRGFISAEGLKIVKLTTSVLSCTNCLFLFLRDDIVVGWCFGDRTQSGSVAWAEDL